MRPELLDLSGVPGLVILNLKSEEPVNGIDRVRIAAGDLDLAARWRGFDGVMDLLAQFLHLLNAGRIQGVDKHRRIEISGGKHSCDVGQMLANLVGNSLKYVEKEIRPRVRIWAEEYPDSVRLWIQDNGIGIASEHQERIFHVFERLHGPEHYPGTGIGLAIVRKGAERMGGQVGVQSQPGQGSRFWVQLPKPRDGRIGSS